MWHHYYVHEKLRELEAERLSRKPAPPPEGKPLLRPLVRLAGRALRRTGEGLESWAAVHQAEQQEWESRRAAERG